jgi:hypothetical protein
MRRLGLPIYDETMRALDEAIKDPAWIDELSLEDAVRLAANTQPERSLIKIRSRAERAAMKAMKH